MAKKTGVDIHRTMYATFRGADFSTDPSLVERYRSPRCANVVADGGGMPQKRWGWRTLHTLPGAVNGLFAARFPEGERTLAHVGERLYLWEEERPPLLLLTGLPDRKSRGACLGGKLWIVTGDGFFVYDGETARRVGAADGYVPLTTITRTPAGGGVSYEDVNLLTPYRKNGFQTDGESVTFTLDGEIDGEGTVRCWVWGEEVFAFTADREAGTVTLETAPPAPEAGQADGLVVEFPHTVPGYADRIHGCTIVTTFGVGANDRLVVSGNPAFPHWDWTGALGDPTYFPDLGYAAVGGETAAIRGYLRLGEDLAIVKEDDGRDSTVFLRSAVLDGEGGAVFPLRQAVAGVGAVSPGSFASLQDDPLFLSRTGVTAVASNAVTSEKICQDRSFYVNNRLTKEEGLADAEAVVWNGMYLLSPGNGHVYVLDGRQPKSYRSAGLGDFVYECAYWEDVPARVWLCRKSGAGEDLFFGTADGRICRMNSDREGMDRYSDDGRPIRAEWATRYDDDGTPALLKTMIKRGCCVTIRPHARSSAQIFFRTDRTGGESGPIAGKTMDILDFADVDVERIGFQTEDSPQEIFQNRKVKNYKRLQILVRNEEANEGFGIFQITKHYVVGNYAKR